ncbi:hypothetical protein N7462_001624 [Penicillium macrosclerotiorum]|uniref:uncharacterized protein n=1 Tax=Penicillium macrosclerotiorum TaxID=303699 RepID=UPI002547382D|nr:uncharacterized protein N7462_001624 [Penicillium macrosclerotiorum]KAJ5692201.1 hypothetical protein N7462_001624 [Penicillium macrosclerotiorum]
MSQVVYITTETASEPACVDYIHPNLIEIADPVKGRGFRASEVIPKGARLMVDRPYAIIPTVDEPANHDNVICSNPACNHRTLQDAGRCLCPNNCVSDVVWCSNACRNADRARHEFECTWLKRYAQSIRSKRGEYDFGMLWLIVRLLATRHIEMKKPSLSVDGSGSAREWKSSWNSIDLLCGSSDFWSHDKVRLWSTLVKKYLQNSSTLPHGMSADRLLHLICQEEANSFGLYPREMCIDPPSNMSPSNSRGEQFAAGVYPTAAICNHSCSPNITHRPDDKGCMVYTAARDILAGEECCISYFDLAQHTDLTSRREHLRNSFRFLCKCERCVSEEPVEESIEWTEMPILDI